MGMEMDVLVLGKDSCGQPITNGIHPSYHLIKVFEFQDGLIGSKKYGLVLSTCRPKQLRKL